MVEECSVGGIFDGGGWFCNVSIFCVVCRIHGFSRLKYYIVSSFSLMSVSL